MHIAEDNNNIDSAVMMVSLQLKGQDFNELEIENIVMGAELSDIHINMAQRI